MSESSSMHRVITCRFPDNELKSLRAVSGPELTPRDQASSQTNVARNFANWRKIDSRLYGKPLSLRSLRLDSHLLIKFLHSSWKGSDAQNSEKGKRKSH